MMNNGLMGWLDRTKVEGRIFKFRGKVRQKQGQKKAKAKAKAKAGYRLKVEGI